MSVTTIIADVEWRNIGKYFTPTGDKYLLENPSSIGCQIGFGTAVAKDLVLLYPLSSREISIKNTMPITEVFIRTLLQEPTSIVIFDND